MTEDISFSLNHLLSSQEDCSYERDHLQTSPDVYPQLPEGYQWRTESYQDLIQEGLRQEKLRSGNGINQWRQCTSCVRFIPASINGPVILVDETANLEQRISNHGKEYMLSHVPSINRSGRHPEDCYKFTLRRTCLK